MNIIDLFQGISTMFSQSPQVVICRIVLIFTGFLLVYLGSKGTLEPLIMVPMGLGMSAVNAGMLYIDAGKIGNLIIDPLLKSTDDLMKYMQIDFLQPILVDLNRAALEIAYRNKYPKVPIFFEHLLRLYEAGRLPCGWNGSMADWPAGNVIAY